MTQRTTQLASLIDKSKNENSRAEQAEGPPDDESDRECQRNRRTDREEKEVKINESRVAAGKDEHHHKNKDNQDSNTNFLQQDLLHVHCAHADAVGAPTVYCFRENMVSRG